jgi:hypothetical protein
MKKVFIQFKSLADMLDFESIIVNLLHDSDHSQLWVFGEFEEADIELAKAGYGAEVIEDACPQ